MVECRYAKGCIVQGDSDFSELESAFEFACDDGLMWLFYGFVQSPKQVEFIGCEFIGPEAALGVPTFSGVGGERKECVVILSEVEEIGGLFVVSGAQFEEPSIVVEFVVVLLGLDVLLEAGGFEDQEFSDERVVQCRAVMGDECVFQSSGKNGSGLD